MLEHQIDQKALATLKNKDPVYALTQNITDENTRSAVGVAKSSLIGRDPWGDKKYPEPATATGTGVSTRATSRTEPAYSNMQLLLMEVQDRNYSYLTAHIPLLLEEVLCTELRETESLYKDDVGNVRTTTARKRMPWQAYRDCILSGLPEDKGTHDLSAIMTLTRTKGESAISWAQRMNEGKKVVEKKKIELTDAIYADLTLRYLCIEEMKWLIKAYTDALADASAVGTTVTALPWRKSLRQIESMKWKGLRELIKGMNVQTFKPYQPG